LDLAIPDYNPPTIIFKTDTIVLDQEFSNSGNIEQLIQLLIDDISYVDINQENNEKITQDISLVNTNYTYYNNDIKEISNNITTYRDTIIEIDITPIFDNDKLYQLNGENYANIIYKIKDYANNENLIERPVKVKAFFQPPKIYYINTDNEITETNFDIPLNILEPYSNDSIIQKAKNNIIIEDVQDDNNFYTKEDRDFDNLLSITIEFKNGVPNEVIYNVSSRFGVNNFITRRRIIEIVEEEIEEEIEPKRITHCCYPKVYYKEIQHNYKLGSFGSTAMRRAKFIINS